MRDDDLRPEYDLANLVPVPPEKSHFRNRPTRPVSSAHAYLFIQSVDGSTHVAVPGSYDVHTHTYATHCGFPNGMGPHSGRFRPVVMSSIPPDSLCKACAAAAGITFTAVSPADDAVIDNKAVDDLAVQFVRDFVALFRDSDMCPEDECHALYARAVAILAAAIDTNQGASP
jgi:hypothetical protein